MIVILNKIEVIMTYGKLLYEAINKGGSSDENWK